MRTLIVHNGASGFGSDAVYLFERSLLHTGDRCEFRSLAADWDADEAVADADDFDLVVVSGGDGTVASLLYALRRHRAIVCVFPSGTANLFFASLGNSPEPAALARACRIGRTMECDLGEVGWMGPEGREHRAGFTLMSGTGFDAELMRAAVPNKKAMGQAAYLMAAVGNPNPPLLTFTVEADGETFVREGIACIAANSAMLQGDLEIVPDSRLDDGLLDIIVLESPDAVGLLKPLFLGLIDRHGANLGRPSIERFRAREATISSSRPIPMQIDGDPLDHEVSSFTARILPERCRLVVDALSPYAVESGEAPLFPGTEVKAFPTD